MTTKQRNATANHPLQEVVLEIFRDQVDELDPASLGRVLGGGSAAYRKVASEVLESLERQGRVKLCTDGLYRLADAFEALTEVSVCGFRYPTLETAPKAFHSRPIPPDQVINQVREYLSREPRTSYVVAVVPIGQDGTTERSPISPAD